MVPHVDTEASAVGPRADLLGLGAAVVAVTYMLERAAVRIGAVLGKWRRPAGPGVAPRLHSRRDWEIRRQEEKLMAAGDAHAVERLERDWDRRDTSGVSDWNWR